MSVTHLAEKSRPVAPRPPAEEDLLERIRSGDREAAAAFLDLHRPLLAHRLRWRVRRGDYRLSETDDLVSTVARRFDRYVAEHGVQASRIARLMTLLHTIADAAANEALRRARRVRLRERQAALRGVSIAQTPPCHGAEPSEWSRLDDLDPLSRDVVTLRMRGLDNADIARALDLPDTQVRKRFSRAMDRLRQRATRTRKEGTA